MKKIYKGNKYVVNISGNEGRAFSTKKEAMSYAKENHGIGYKFYIDKDTDEIKSETIADYSKISIEFDSDELSWIRAALINAHDKVRERKDDDEKEACDAILNLLHKINEVNPL